MSLLTIVQNACDRLGLPRPSVVMASGDDTVRILRGLANQEGKELAARGTWQRLVREATFSTVAQTVQTGAVPSDFSHFINSTVWNYTQQEPLRGPLDPQEWQMLNAGLVAPADLYFRVRGNDFLILPDPPVGEEIRFEYVSSWWVDTDADGVGEADAWAADSNTALLPEELLTLGIIWRWLKSRRMAFAEEFAEYNVQVNQALGRDGGKRVVNMGAGDGFTDSRGSGASGARGWENLQSNWGENSRSWGNIQSNWSQV
jgi:hypothetical protein